MSTPGTAPSPWGEPARVPTVTAEAIPESSEPEQPLPARSASVPLTRRTVTRPKDPSQWERARAAATLAVVAIILGAAAAGVLGVSVWAIAALFHHAASG